MKNKRKTNEEYINEATVVHGGFYNYSLIEYKNNKSNIDIICPNHGVFSQGAKNHLNGSGCPKCANKKSSEEKFKTSEQFIEESIKVYGDLYDYSLTEYKGALDKVKVVCKIHGVFEQRAASHLRGHGCSKCGREITAKKKSKPIDEFIGKAIEVHSGVYDYSKAEYKNNKSKVEIICSSHGTFFQTPSSHLRGRGCPECGKEKSAAYRSLNPPGWSYSCWRELAEKSKYFDSYKVYILRCWDEQEEFYKIGRTFRTTQDRFRKEYDLPYNFEVLEVSEYEDAFECCEREQELKNRYSDYRYFPLKEFGGSHECFSKL